MREKFSQGGGLQFEAEGARVRKQSVRQSKTSYQKTAREGMAKVTSVAETNEEKRLKEQQAAQSTVGYKKKAMDGLGKVSAVAETQEEARLKAQQKAQSTAVYKADYEANVKGKGWTETSTPELELAKKSVCIGPTTRSTLPCAGCGWSSPHTPHVVVC